MDTTDFDTFRSQALGNGFTEVVERRWEPGTVVDTHTHPFEASALVVQGELWLTVAGRTQHLQPGGHFALAAGVPHEERYGAEGATFWVARR
jgi:quercetin dioxygenase-like cupin family protein